MPAMNSEPLEREDEQKLRQDSLALLYQGVFTGIVRLQSGRQKLSDPATFRRRIKDTLQDVQKEATVAGYNNRAIKDAEAAVVAFLDEAVLSLKDPARDAWAKQTLSLDLYAESNAGEVFFERLEELRGQTDSVELSDVLEVYLLCLLLGFEGRYSGPMRAQAAMIADRLRTRVEGLRGSTNYRLSPPFRFTEVPMQAAPARQDNHLKWWLLGVTLSPLVLFLFYKLNLSILVNDFLSMLPGVS